MLKNRLKKFLILAVATMLFVVSTPHHLFATDFSCADVAVVFARGTGEPKNGPNYQAFLSSLQSLIKKHAPRLAVTYHELDYPAAGASNFAETLATKVTAGEAFSFNDSVQAGQANLQQFITRTTRHCPTTKFVLAGYSQGAMVISKSLPKLKSSQIIYAATFGDPKLHLPEGKGTFPDACYGRNLSNYRQTVPDCRTHTGILTALKNYQPQGYKDKLGAWCNVSDFMCGSYFDFFNLMKGHTTYTSNNAYPEAAAVIIASIKKFFPTVVSASITAKVSKKDVAILIDTTGSMASVISFYQSEALRLARQTTEAGGRVALYTYGDLADRRPERLCDFTADFTTFQIALSQLKVAQGGNFAESALSGLLHTMNTLKWQKGAEKAIVLLTDASYHSPDLDGTTLPQVVQRSLEIDPVNVFIATGASTAPSYQLLARATGGFVSTIDTSSIITEHLKNRPHLELDQEFYHAPLGEPLQVKITASAQIQHYEWDLDGDGEFERTTTTPTISHIYTEPLSGFIQVKAVADSGYYSTAAAPFRIFSPDVARIMSANLSLSGSSATLSFTTEHTAATLVLVGDAPLTITTTHQLTLSLPRATNLTLIPISPSGTPGTPQVLTAVPAGTIPTAPHTGCK